MTCDNVPAAGEPSICEVGGGGLFLPLFPDYETTLPNNVRAVMYFALLFWCFLGVAIIADIFMAAIEKVTSQKVSLLDPAIGKYRTATVWNATVANLTLMALGSSAPEILLNVIGIFPTFLSGDLGPSTIVGSAAFNLLVIIAVCVVSIPNGETRKINDLGVYSITATFSLFAYVWLLIILVYISPNVVELWEGLVTFGFFWVLILLAWLADTGKLPGTSKTPSGLTVHRESTKEELRELHNHIQKKYGTALLPEQEALLIQEEAIQQTRTRAHYRIHATRMLSGGRKIFQTPLKSKDYQKLEQVSPRKSEVVFKEAHITVLESMKKAIITIVCAGNSEPVVVRYHTRDGTARAGQDYTATEGTLTFSGRETEQTITIPVVESKGQYKETKDFFVDLDNPKSTNAFALGQCRTAQVSIIDEDLPGTLLFAEERIQVPGEEKGTELDIKVIRKKGSAGEATVNYRTEADSAVGGADYVHNEGTLKFRNNETSKIITVKILPKGKYESDETFRVILEEPSAGVKFDNTTDGGSESAICSVIIKGDAVAQHLQINWDRMKLGNHNWKEQFISAWFVNGSKEDMMEATCLEWVLHFLSLPWKLLFAFVPPTEYANGWISFFCALAMVGFVTVIIGDTAELLGCVMGIPESTTAITLVAMGTSLPDTFASRTAARMDPYADNSIGNVTGSNSVNVFLGLGLPWMLCCIYWTFVANCSAGDGWSMKFPDEAALYPTGVFVVQAGALGSSVTVFSFCGLLCVGCLGLRRACLGGELGGNPVVAYITAIFFFLLWVAYIVFSILAAGE